MDDQRFSSVFSCTVYDFLHCNGDKYKDGFERYYGNELRKKLKKVAKEFFIVDRHLNGHFTKEFLAECMNGKYSGFIRYRLKPYFTPFLNVEEYESLYR